MANTADSKREWKVEGLSEGDEAARSNWRRQIPRRRRLWLVLLVALTVNWALSSRLMAPEAPISIPYTTFIEQLDGGNVEYVVAIGEEIQGEFAIEITDPNDEELESTSFTTLRPAFAEDDLLEAERLADEGSGLANGVDQL